MFGTHLQQLLDHVAKELSKVRNGRYPGFSQTWSTVSGEMIRRLGRRLTQNEQKAVWNGLIDVFPTTNAKRWM